MGLYKAPHTQSIKHMKEFKEGDILTLKDVQESFDRINNLSDFINFFNDINHLLIEI